MTASAELARSNSAARAIASRTIRSEARPILRRIREENVTLALWDRRLPEPVAAFVSHLAQSAQPLSPDVSASVGSMLLMQLARAYPFTTALRNAAAHWLLEDIVALATDVAAAADCTEVRVRLTRIADRGCAAFHVDTLPVRLLCTYAGPGMQWAGEPDVRRDALGIGQRSIEETNAAIVPDATRIRTMATGAVAIFKGRLWPGAAAHALVHRSYPVCCGEHARLRLVIDPAGHRY